MPYVMVVPIYEHEVLKYLDDQLTVVDVTIKAKNGEWCSIKADDIDKLSDVFMYLRFKYAEDKLKDRYWDNMPVLFVDG